MADRDNALVDGGPEETRTVPVRFDSDGVELVGEIYLPQGHDAAGHGPLPGVVVTGTWTSVRQQMAQRYARKLAAEGMAALSFDYRTYGESGGEPRQIEAPTVKVRDITNAARFLTSREEVDGERVGGKAICASVMYMAHALARDAPLKAFAASAAWIHDPGTVGLMYGGEEGLKNRIDAGLIAGEKYRRTGEVDYVPAESPDDESAAMVGVPFYEDPDRGNIPQWTNRFAVMQWPEWLTLDGIAPARAIGAPTMMIHSDGSALPDNVRRFHAALSGPKTLVWAEGEHTEFYDREPQVNLSASVAAAFFRTVM